MKFPDKKLNAARPYDRGSLKTADLEQLADELTIEWKDLVQVKRLRVDIPVVIDYEARAGEIAEFVVKSVCNSIFCFLWFVILNDFKICVLVQVNFIGAKVSSGYKYSAFAKPRAIRWKINE